MKKVLIFVLCVLFIGGLFIACGQQSMPVSLKSNVIRLHILANSDTDTDQDIKLKVRDMVLEQWGKTLASLESSSEAWGTLDSLLPDIKKDIDNLLDELDAGYGASLETGVYDFPERDYSGVVFPGGKYRALKVSLGEAAGRNWWCVMFPPLCLIGDDGEMNIEQYKELVRALEAEGIDPDDLPDAPVRSWLYDQLFGKNQWDRDFLEWAKKFWTEGDD